MDPPMTLPLVLEAAGEEEELVLTRFNFVPEGMSRWGARLNIDPQTQQATFHSVHCEKENKSFVFQGPVCEASAAEHVLLYEPGSGKVRLKKIQRLINLKNVRSAGASGINGLIESPSKKSASSLSLEQRPNSSSDIDQLEAELLGDMDTIIT